MFFKIHSLYSSLYFILNYIYNEIYNDIYNQIEDFVRFVDDCTGEWSGSIDNFVMWITELNGKNSSPNILDLLTLSTPIQSNGLISPFVICSVTFLGQFISSRNVSEQIKETCIARNMVSPSGTSERVYAEK